MNDKNPNPNAGLASLYEKRKLLNADEAMGLDVFNQAVRGIHSQRQERGDAAAERKVKLDAEWERVMKACVQLKQRLEGHPKLQAFLISERARRVQIALRQGEGKQPFMISASRDHFNPDHNRVTQALWVFRPGNDNRQYDSADLLVRELATTLASYLT